MKIVDHKGVVQWCAENSFRFTKGRKIETLTFEKNLITKVLYPSDAVQITRVAFTLVNNIDFIGEESCLFYLYDGEIWSPEYEEIGRSLLYSLIGKSDFSWGNGIVLRKNDLINTKTLCMLAMLFQWDVYFAVNRGQMTILFSHDGFIKFSHRDGDSKHLVEEYCENLELKKI